MKVPFVYARDRADLEDSGIWGKCLSVKICPTRPLNEEGQSEVAGVLSRIIGGDDSRDLGGRGE